MIPTLQKASAALGEICNIIAGYFKAKAGLGGACVLSLPTIVVGQNLQISFGKNVPKTGTTVSYEGEQLLATLEIAR